MSYSDTESESSESSLDLGQHKSNGIRDQVIPLSAVSPSDRLHVAAGKGQLNKVKELLSQGVICQPDAFGYSPLHRAATAGHVEVTKLLLSVRCSIDLQDLMNGNTALHEASWNGFSQTVQTLITGGANVQIQNKGGFSALHMCAQNGHNQCSRYLVYAGCSSLLKNNYGDTALHTAARYGHAGVAQILSNASHSVVNEPNQNGDTALHIAAALKRRKITGLLLDANCNVNCRNKQGELAMEIALRKGNLEIVQLLNEYVMKNCQNIKPNTTEEPAAPELKAKKKKLSFFKKKKSKIKDKEEAENKSKTQIKSEKPQIDKSAVNAEMAQQLVAGFQKFRQYQQQKQLQPDTQVSQLMTHDDSYVGLQSGYLRHKTASNAAVLYYRDLAGNIHQERAQIQGGYRHNVEMMSHYPVNRSHDSACCHHYPVPVPNTFTQHRLLHPVPAAGYYNKAEPGPDSGSVTSPGRIYRSKSDETLSQVSSVRPYEVHGVESDDSRHLVNKINSRVDSRRSQQIEEGSMLVVPANVRDWFSRQNRPAQLPLPQLSRADNNRQSMFLSRTRFTQIQDL